MQKENKKITKNTSVEMFCQNISTKSKGFTLVELIIVITILAILGTIAYISFQGYTKDARDGIRMSDIKQIYNGLSIYKTQTEKTLLPDNYINIQSGTTTISYQGYAGTSVLRTLKISGGKDPGTKDYYIYTTDVNTKKAQLMTYMETSDKDVQLLSQLKDLNIINQTQAITNTGYYQDKKIYVYGDKIGILTDSNKVPLQETTSSTGINIITTTTPITTYFGGNVYSGGVSTSTGVTLINEINGALNNLTSNKYIVSGTITNGSGGTINGCGTSTNIDSSGNFTLSNINYGTNCSGVIISRNGYNCSISTNGPISLISNINNITGSCSLQYLDVANSLRFDSSRSTYLKRTINGNGSNIWAYSFWFKPTKSGGTFLSSNNGSSNNDQDVIYSDMSGYFGTSGNGAGSVYGYRISESPITNYDRWYNLVFIYDSPQDLPENRIKIYVDGVKMTVNGRDLGIIPKNWVPRNVNKNGYITGIGGFLAVGGASATNVFDGYMSEINFIDGQALGPSDFGVNIGGKWLPKSYTGTYGTNGFHLNFSNSGNLGDDVAGTNDWTLQNYGTPANDQMIDSPTNNFNTWNYNAKYSSNCSLTNGGLKFGNGSFGSTGRSFSTNLINSGKWYFEISANFGTPSGSYAPYFGFVRQGYLNTSTHIGDDANSWGFSINGGGGTGYKRNNSSTVSLSFTISNNSWFGVRLDADTGTFDVTPDGTNWYNIYSGMTGPFYFAYGDRGGIPDHQANFGQGGQSGLVLCSGAGGYFKYCPPAGFKALSSKNIGN